MKVLLLNQVPEVNNKYTFSLARSISKYGAKVVVYGIDDDNYDEYRDVKIVNRFEHFGDKKNAVSKMLSYIRSWRQIIRYCKKRDYDIIHVQWYGVSFVDYVCHKRLQKQGIKVVATIHDLLPFHQLPYDRLFYKKIYNNADIIISQAVDNEPILISDFNVSKKKIRYIPHGNYMDYAEIIEKSKARDYLNLPDDKQIILFFGQIKKVKGVDVLLKSVADMNRNREDFLCVIAGKTQGEDYDKYQNFIEKQKINEVVRSDIRFIPDDEIKYYFTAADIVALPYLELFQSGVLLLAYAYGKPIVCTDRGEFKTLVKNGETGLIVPANNHKALAKALTQLLNNPEYGLKMAIQGKAYIEEKLSWDKIGSQIVEVYKSVL